jgi:hypothetical protein
VLQKFFFVGVGGSGGVTLRFLRTLLNTRLTEQGYHGGIPAAWQFAHIDVPVTQDTQPESLPLLPDNTYAGLARRGMRYLDLDDTVRRQGVQTVRHTAGWCPDPQNVHVDPTAGAGRFRAVGRMILGAQLSSAFNVLKTGFSTMEGTSANQEFSEVCLALTGSGEFVAQAPQVVVISSLAGGSGAGAVRDVCDLVLQLEPNAENRLVSVLYTPEVFDELQQMDRDGTYPNALAALSELLNGYWTAETPSEDEFAFLSAASAFTNRGVRRRGPRIMYIIGRSNGEITFANQAEVYRAVGKGLAVLATSATVQDRMRSKEIGNWTARAAAGADNSGLCAAVDERPLSSFGFASVSIGLDRFARYAAERLARTAVDHLLEGHWKKPDRDSGRTEEAVRKERAEDVFRGFLTGVGLREDGPYNNDVIDAIRGGTEQDARRRIVEQLQELVLAEVSQAWPANATADFAGSRIVERMTERWPTDYTQVQQEYLNNTTVWVGGLQEKVAEVAARLVAHEGLPVAREVLGLCIEQLTDVVVPELEAARDAHRRVVGELRQRVKGSLAGITGAVQRGNPRIAAAVGEALSSFHAHTEELVNDLAADLIGDIAENLLRPLQRAVTDADQRLTLQKQGTSISPSLVDQWPVDEKTVPTRYLPAPNELVLEPVASYPELFKTQVQAQVGDPAFRNALQTARREIVQGVRENLDGRQTVIASPGVWQPRDKRLPQSAVAHPAEFQVGVDDEQVLGRARAWIERPDCAMGVYLGQKLTDYLGRLAPDERTRAERGEAFRRELAQAVVLSRPLVRIDPRRLGAVHPPRGIGYKEVLTRFPFEPGHPGRDAVAKVFSHYSEADLNGLFGGDDTERIDIFTFYDAPVQPLVMASLVDPIATQWDRDKRIDAAGFWHWRRARPLPQFVPCTPEVRTAIVRGWFAARFLNQVRADGNNAYNSPTEVWSPNGWLRFPFPLIGLPPRRMDTDDWLPAVVESLCLTLVGESFDAYARLVELGRSVADLDTGDLQDWVADGVVPPGAPTPVPARAGTAGGPPQERAAVLTATLDSWIKHFAGYDVWPLKDRRPNGAWELRADITEALTDIRRTVTAAADRRGMGLDEGPG